MDTTPGCARARKIDVDERTELMKAGKCFTCKKQGHLSRDCPQRPPQQQRTNAHANTSKIEDVNSDDEEPTKVRSGKKKPSASEIMEILREADDDAKDSIIQEFFMDFLSWQPPPRRRVTASRVVEARVLLPIYYSCPCYISTYK